MIYVIASVHVRAERLCEFVEIFKSNVTKVEQEKGCIEYFPAIDINADVFAQNLDENVITIIEKWIALNPSGRILKRLICWPIEKKSRIWLSAFQLRFSRMYDRLFLLPDNLSRKKHYL